MVAETELQITVFQSEIQELARLLSKIEMPDVTYSDDILLMAQQALRLNRMYAEKGNGILDRWLGCDIKE